MIQYEKLIKVLCEGGVSFIIVGGVAAVLHGGSRLTLDLDVVYERSRENLVRLTNALRNYTPYLRGAPKGLPFDWSPETLHAGLNFTLDTDLGPLDILGEITGGGRFEELTNNAITVTVFGFACRCLDLPTLIQTKRAAGRAKDLDALSELELILREQQSFDQD